MRCKSDSYDSGIFIDGEFSFTRWWTFLRGNLLQTVSDIIYEIDQEDLERIFKIGNRDAEEKFQDVCDHLTNLSRQNPLDERDVEKVIKDAYGIK